MIIAVICPPDLWCKTTAHGSKRCPPSHHLLGRNTTPTPKVSCRNQSKKPQLTRTFALGNELIASEPSQAPLLRRLHCIELSKYRCAPHPVPPSIKVHHLRLFSHYNLTSLSADSEQDVNMSESSSDLEPCPGPTRSVTHRGPSNESCHYDSALNALPQRKTLDDFPQRSQPHLSWKF
jgi:hypothetical protein